MPDVLNLKSRDWELNVWVKDNSDRLQVLHKTMAGRGRPVPASKLYLSPPSQIKLVEPITEGEGDKGLSSELILPAPAFFENKEYFFEFSFNDLSEFTSNPKIVHRLVTIEDSFHFSKKSNSLHGSINFGNDVGWFRLGLRYITQEGLERLQTISFEVLPTKMAMDSDLAAIHQAIDAAYPLWRFSFAQKTEQELARSHQKHERFALLWLAHFKQLRSRLEDAVKLVLRAPHSRLLPQQRAIKLERLRGRLTPKLEAQIHEHLAQNESHHRYQITSRRLSVDTPENRFVKMVLKRCSAELSAITKLAQKNQKAPEEGGKLSPSFFEELASWKKPLDQLLNQPLFTEIGDYEGLERESLVLHQRAGYANIYRLWQELKMYLGVFGQNAAVSMKSVADLYEVWCFLEVKNMLLTLGFTLQESKQAVLRSNGLERNMRNGDASAFHLCRKSDNVHIKLSHEPKYGRSDKKDEGEIYSWVTEQEPDILLEVRFPDQTTIRWIFDAKYRIDSKSKNDLAPPDAINQMHRYRDALIHIDKQDGSWLAKSRPILGAFVLYPGWFDQSSLETNPYRESIKEVGIGAFPVLPGQSNTWLHSFLEDQLGYGHKYGEHSSNDGDKFFVEDSSRIVTTGMQTYRYDDLALVGFTGVERDASYLEKCKQGALAWYHTPVGDHPQRSISPNVMNETRFCAVAVESGYTRNRLVQFVYEVESVSIVKRSELTLEQAGKTEVNDRPYWLLKLGHARKLVNPIEVSEDEHCYVMHTSMKEILSVTRWSDLSIRYPVLGRSTSLSLA